MGQKPRSRVCLQHSGGFRCEFEPDRGKWQYVVFEKGGKKNKEQEVFTISCSYVSSRHDEHCAFLAVCGLKFFTVLAQFVGVNVSNLLI